MLAHKVRGVAANLGLEQLADALGKLEGLVDGDSGKLYPGFDETLQDSLAQLCVRLDGALAEARAAQPAAAATPVQAARPGADLERAKRAGIVLREALRRGGLDDDASVGLAAALAGHPLAVRAAQVHAAIADFDFELALQQLDAVLGALDDMAQEMTE
jgi:HPt (histidine-containing phosphotransfer) domain-containing protein